MKKRRILLVDSDPGDRALCAFVLTRATGDLEVDEVGDAAALADRLARSRFAAVVTEHRLGWSDGLKVLAVVKGHYPECPVVLFTAGDDPGMVSEALGLGLDRFVPKTSAGYLRLPAVVVELLERAVPRDAGADRRLVNRLQRANEELEEFAQVVSHDLQAPLQVAARYAGLLEEEVGDRLGTPGEKYLRHVVESTGQIQTMIDDILECSRLGTGERAYQPVDLGSVVAEALGNLQELSDESRARITCDPLPTLRVDRPQMVQLVQNLISNALKFRGDKPPRIRVAATEEDDAWVISVEDNGAGIDPRHHRRIFKMFQRAHAASEVPGTGIGLAICKRIVERHGGSIAVESAPSEGSTFSVRLPKDDRPQDPDRDRQPEDRSPGERRPGAANVDR